MQRIVVGIVLHTSQVHDVMRLKINLCALQPLVSEALETNLT